MHLAMRLALGEDSVLRGLAEAEFRLRAGGDLDRLASRGIAAEASLALRLEHLAETGEHDALRALSTGVGDLEELVVRGNGLLLADASGLSDGGHDLGLGSGNFLSHFFDPFGFH